MNSQTTANPETPRTTAAELQITRPDLAVEWFVPSAVAKQLEAELAVAEEALTRIKRQCVGFPMIHADDALRRLAEMRGGGK